MSECRTDVRVAVYLLRMANLFHAFPLTVDRLSLLLVASADNRLALLRQWQRNDLREKKRVPPYALAQAAILGFHEGRYTTAGLSELVSEWTRLAAADRARRKSLLNNARALEQYLVWNPRKFELLPKQMLETCVGAVRIYARPHMYAMSGELRLRVFVDNRVEFTEQFLETKCEATFWIASRMRAETAQVEIEHAAQRRIVARIRARASLGEEISEACKLVEFVWRRASSTDKGTGVADL